MKRSRFYQALIDHALLVPGADSFADLKDSYMISIMPFDLFGLKKFIYIFRMVCINETGFELDDGATRIFINTYGENHEAVTTEFVDLMHYINETKGRVAAQSQSLKVKEIHRRIERIRASEEVGVRWMQEWEEKLQIRREAEKEGREEGMKKGMEKGIKLVINTSRQLGATYDVTRTKLIEELECTEQQADNWMNLYWQ